MCEIRDPEFLPAHCNFLTLRLLPVLYTDRMLSSEKQDVGQKSSIDFQKGTQGSHFDDPVSLEMSDDPGGSKKQGEQTLLDCWPKVATYSSRTLIRSTDNK
jgi:hypothetical protein